MNDMSHEEYVQINRHELIILAGKIIKKSIDIIEGCRKINGLWLKAELPLDDSYYFFSLIDSDTDAIPKGYLRKISSEKYLKEQDKEEKEYLEFFEKGINKECQKLIDKYGMSNLNLQEAFYLIEKNKEHSYMSGPKTDEQIRHLEEILNVSLPPSYKAFLKKYGRGGVGGTDFLGIDNSIEDSEAVTETLSNRKHGLPEPYVIITNDGNGSYCAIDCSKHNAIGESPIIRWASFFKPEKIAEDFGEFMLSDLKNMLDDE